MFSLYLNRHCQQRFWSQFPVPQVCLEGQDRALHHGTAQLQAADVRSLFMGVMAAGLHIIRRAAKHHPVDDGPDLFSVHRSRCNRRRKQGPAESTTVLPGLIGTRASALLAPVGFNWQISVALIPGMAARGSGRRALATVYAISAGHPARPGWQTANCRGNVARHSSVAAAWYGVSRHNAPRRLVVVRRENQQLEKWPVLIVCLHAGLSLRRVIRRSNRQITATYLGG